MPGGRNEGESRNDGFQSGQNKNHPIKDECQQSRDKSNQGKMEALLEARKR
jgi:hypothetical protein